MTCVIPVLCFRGRGRECAARKCITFQIVFKLPVWAQHWLGQIHFKTPWRHNPFHKSIQGCIFLTKYVIANCFDKLCYLIYNVFKSRIQLIAHFEICLDALKLKRGQKELYKNFMPYRAYLQRLNLSGKQVFTYICVFLDMEDIILPRKLQPLLTMTIK